jgi:hypothetical protein
MKQHRLKLLRQALKTHLSITAFQAPSDPSIFNLYFSRIFTPFDSRIGGECNGLVIRQTGDKTFEVVARPIFRFHNVESDGSIPIELTNDKGPVLLHEFVDGRNVLLFHDGAQWRVSTSTSFDASDAITESDASKTVASSFWRVWNSAERQLPTNTNLTYTFQLVLKDYPLILPYEKDDCVLVAIRDRTTGLEQDVFGEETARLGCTVPTRKTLEDLKNLKAERFAKSTGKFKKKASEPLQQEDIEYLAAHTWQAHPGWVVRHRKHDGIFYRAVVTSPMVSNLTQFRYGTRQQQEALLLPLFARYSFYKHPAVLKCPFPAVEQESNCCEAFDYVRNIFDALCADIDEKVEILSRDYHDRTVFAPAAEKIFPLDCVRFDVSFTRNPCLNSTCLAFHYLGQVQSVQHQGVVRS